MLILSIFFANVIHISNYFFVNQGLFITNYCNQLLIYAKKLDQKSIEEVKLFFFITKKRQIFEKHVYYFSSLHLFTTTNWLHKPWDFFLPRSKWKGDIVDINATPWIINKCNHNIFCALLFITLIPLHPVKNKHFCPPFWLEYSSLLICQALLH